MSTTEIKATPLLNLGISFNYIDPYEDSEKYQDCQLAHWKKIESIKSLENKLLYYNENVASLSLFTMAGNVRLKIKRGYSNIVFPCIRKGTDDSKFRSHEHLTFLRLRRNEVNRIVSDLKKLPNYTAKLEYLFSLKGGGFRSLIVTPNHKWNGISDDAVIMLSAPAVVDLFPKTTEEIYDYNKAIEKHVMAEIVVKSELDAKKYKGFKYKDAVKRLEKTLASPTASNKATLIEKLINQIQKETECNNPESSPQDFSYSEVMYQNLQLKLSSFNIFEVINRDEEIPYDQVIFSKEDVLTIFHTKQIHRFYRYLLDRLIKVKAESKEQSDSNCQKENTGVIIYVPDIEASNRYIKPGYLNWLSEFENKITDWDSWHKTKYAAWVELIMEKGYFFPDYKKHNLKSCREFAKFRYGVRLGSTILPKQNKLRDPHKEQLKKHFR